MVSPYAYAAITNDPSSCKEKIGVYFSVFVRSCFVGRSTHIEKGMDNNKIIPITKHVLWNPAVPFAS